jgi:hypothetical protein
VSHITSTLRPASRPPRCLGVDTTEPKLRESQLIHKYIDRADWIILANPILQVFREQRALPAIKALNEAPHPILPRINIARIARQRVFTQPGSFLFMGLTGVVIASLVNLFIGSSALQFLISVVGVLVFTGLTAYDTQNIKEQFAEEFGSESKSKLAVWGALSLYLNFINIFQLLLNLTGDREG